MKTKRLEPKPVSCPRSSNAAMTLVEVVIALAISGLAVGAVVTGYTYSTTSAEKAALSMAADARAMQRIEETRSAQWITSTWPQVDQLVGTNFPGKVVTLDLSGSGAGATLATITTEISQVSINPPLKRIHVECIWQFKFKGYQWVTNAIETCRAPDQ